MASICSTKRTGLARCAPRASARPSGARVAAVVFDHTGTFGAVKATPRRCSAKASAAGATSGEWKAVATASFVARRPAALQRAITASMPGIVPATTVCSGAFRLAMTTPSTRSGVTSAAVPVIAAIAPGISLAFAMSTPRVRAAVIQSA